MPSTGLRYPPIKESDDRSAQRPKPLADSNSNHCATLPPCARRVPGHGSVTTGATREFTSAHGACRTGQHVLAVCGDPLPPRPTPTTASLWGWVPKLQALVYDILILEEEGAGKRCSEWGWVAAQLGWAGNETNGWGGQLFLRVWRSEARCFKPVLNWANVCSPNILRTVRRIMICFLVELLVRRTWFGQFDELYFLLIWLVMRCKLRPELAADAQETAWSKM